MSTQCWRQNFTDLKNTLDRLAEALTSPMDTKKLVMDATIRRFRLCIELFWKNLKNLILQEGIETTSPKQAITQAYQMKWLNNEEVWLGMLQDRNMMSHTYKKVQADAIYGRIQYYFPEMQAVYEHLTTIVSKLENTSDG